MKKRLQILNSTANLDQSKSRHSKSSSQLSSSMRKARGVIDPFTLGFLMALIGGTIGYATNNRDTNPSDSEQQVEAAEVQVESTEHLAFEDDDSDCG